MKLLSGKKYWGSREDPLLEAYDYKECRIIRRRIKGILLSFHNFVQGQNFFKASS